MAKTTSISFNSKPITRSYLNEAMADMGISLPGHLLDVLMLAYHEGRLLLLDRPTKEAIVGAAEAKMQAKAEKAARAMTYLVLFEEGYRADPYER